MKAAKAMTRTLPIGDCRDGFTLLELMLVVAILAVLTLAIAPRFGGGLERARLRESVYGAAYLASSAARISSANGCVVRLVFGEEDGVVKLESDNEEVEMGSAGKPLVLTEGMRIASVEVVRRGGNEEADEDTVLFYADGRADAACIVFAQERGDAYSLRINGVTAHASVIHGEVGPDDWSELDEVRTSQSRLGQE